MSAPAPTVRQPQRRPVAGWLVWLLGWVACITLLVAVVALTGGPIAYWTEELSPPATGGIMDGVISAAICGGLLAVLWGAVLAITRILRVLGTRLRTRRASQKLATDLRPPVLYLRSFEEDRSASSTFDSFEQSLASVVSDIGPVIAVGRPGERLPPLGAARLYLSQESWQPTVRDLMARSALTILKAGVTEGVLWELARAVEYVPPKRFLIAVPSVLSKLQTEAWERFRALAAHVLPRSLPVLTKGAMFVSFDADWNPSLLVDPKKTDFLVSGRANVRKLLRPFCEASGLKLRKRSASDVRLEALLAFALTMQAGTVIAEPSKLYWRELSSTVGGFTVSIPGKYYEKTTTETQPVELRTHEYGVLRRGRSLEFLVSFSDTNVNLSQNLDGVFRGAREAVVAHLKGKLRKEAPLQIASYSGREWEIETVERQEIARIRMYVVGSRTYMLFVALPVSGSEDQEGRRFLESFRLVR